MRDDRPNERQAELSLEERAKKKNRGAKMVVSVGFEPTTYAYLQKNEGIRTQR